jgi:hypothetical protein
MPYSMIGGAGDAGDKDKRQSSQNVPPHIYFYPRASLVEDIDAVAE